MFSTKLTGFEHSLIRMFFDLYPQWELIVNKQICFSDIKRIGNFSNFSIIFTNNTPTEHLPINTSMPVEVILGEVDIPANYTMREINGYRTIAPCIISVLDDDAVGIRIYFEKGLLSELEVYTLSGAKLVNNFLLDRQRTYIISKTGDGSLS